MNTYKRHRFHPQTISYAVWLYYRFNLRRVVTAIEISKIYSLNEVLPSAAKLSDSGVSNTVPSIPVDSSESTEATVIPFYIDEVFAVTTRPACRTIQINGY